MAGFGAPVLLLSDFSDFGRREILGEALQEGDWQALCSPDGRYLFLLLRRQRKLLGFPRLGQPQLQPSHLEKRWPPLCPQLAGVLFPRCSGLPWVLALVWENGQAEVWRPPLGTSSKGWTLLQSLELCNSPRVRVASVCCSEGDLLWCEERPPSEAKPATSRPPRYCVCQRSLRPDPQQVTLSGMKVILHHIPPCRLLASPHHVFMVPDSSTKGVLLVYSRADQKIVLASASRGLIHSKDLADGESDFQKMVVEHLGLVHFNQPPDILSCTLTETGELLLVDAGGHVLLLHPDGVVRHIYTLSVCGPPVAMQLSAGTLACLVNTVLFLIDVLTGRLMEKKVLTVSTSELVFLKIFETDAVQFLTKTGVYSISRSASVKSNGKLEPALLEMIFEEACKYYQKRSLNGAKLTVLSLKEEGMFQAPITLLAILKYFQRKEKLLDQKYVDLLSVTNQELQNYVSLEALKTCVINADEHDMETCCEDLVGKEIERFLHTDLDRENLVYINSLFSMFPKASWIALRNSLQFQENGDRQLVARATGDIWKKVLGPLPPWLKDGPQNGVYPLFEVICRSLYTFKPRWLPGFVRLSQDCLGLSYSKKDNSDRVPLYKRALSVLGKRKENTTLDQDLEIEILLSSGRPSAISQAIHLLIGFQRWERVMEETKKFSLLSPLIGKDIFTTLLVEFVKNRHLDAYIDQLCEICPDDMTPTDFLRIVLLNLPKEGAEAPFSREGSRNITIFLL
uniref:HPS6 biosis of lysosomal organelles complex 2 subunit 3 n=1 Tax=Leptobrachium leishanense TaxID=445787 RepID=A0A8C5MB27_9ANUR